MSIMEDATKLVSIADIFSNNESLEEVPTENLKYLLLPVILGTLATKICNVDDRMHLVNISQVYFTDFLQRAKAYGITDYEIPEEESTELVTSSEGRAGSNTEMIAKMVSSCRRSSDPIIFITEENLNYRKLFRRRRISLQITCTKICPFLYFHSAIHG